MAAEGFGERVVVGTRAEGLAAARVRELAAGGAGLVAGAGADALVYLGVNGPAFPVALFAAARAGVPLVPVNYRLGAEQLAKVLANHPRAYGIAASPDELAALERAGISSHSHDQWLELTATEAADDGKFVDTEAPAVIIYTSGSTADPKGVILRHHNLVSYVIGSVEFAAADADDAALMSVP